MTLDDKFILWCLWEKFSVLSVLIFCFVDFLVYFLFYFSHFLRRFDFSKMFGGKISKEIHFPEDLNIRPFMSVKAVRKFVLRQFAQANAIWD